MEIHTPRLGWVRADYLNFERIGVAGVDPASERDVSVVSVRYKDNAVEDFLPSHPVPHLDVDYISVHYSDGSAQEFTAGS